MRRSKNKKREVTFTTTIEVEVEVTGTIIPGDPGKTYGPMEDCYPGYPAEIDEMEVRLIVDDSAPCTFKDMPRSRGVVDITNSLPKETLEELEDKMLDEVIDPEEGDSFRF